MNKTKLLIGLVVLLVVGGLFYVIYRNTGADAYDETTGTKGPVLAEKFLKSTTPDKLKTFTSKILGNQTDSNKKYCLKSYDVKLTSKAQYIKRSDQTPRLGPLRYKSNIKWLLLTDYKYEGNYIHSGTLRIKPGTDADFQYIGPDKLIRVTGEEEKHLIRLGFDENTVPPEKINTSEPDIAKKYIWSILDDNGINQKIEGSIIGSVDDFIDDPRFERFRNIEWYPLYVNVSETAEYSNPDWSVPYCLNPPLTSDPLF